MSQCHITIEEHNNHLIQPFNVNISKYTSFHILLDYKMIYNVSTCNKEFQTEECKYTNIHQKINFIN